MVAVGSLYSIWTDLPEEPAGLKDAFIRHFGHSWDQVMAGAAKPLAHHRDWDALVAVSDLRECRDLRLSAFLRQGESGEVKVINIIAG